MTIRFFDSTRVRPSRCAPALIAAMILAASGCGDDTASPPRIGLTVTAVPESGRPDAPVTVRARFENVGKREVRYSTGCGVPHGAAIRILDRYGNALELQPPGPTPGCPSREAALKPGRSVEETLEFNGSIWISGVEYAAPPGVYTALATFNYSDSGKYSDEGGVIVEVTTFRWQ